MLSDEYKWHQPLFLQAAEEHKHRWSLFIWDGCDDILMNWLCLSPTSPINQVRCVLKMISDEYEWCQHLLLQAAEEHNCAIFVHPWDMEQGGRMQKYWLPWLVGELHLLCLDILPELFRRTIRCRKVKNGHDSGLRCYNLCHWYDICWVLLTHWGVCCYCECDQSEVYLPLCSDSMVIVFLKSGHALYFLVLPYLWIMALTIFIAVSLPSQPPSPHPPIPPLFFFLFFPHAYNNFLFFCCQVCQQRQQRQLCPCCLVGFLKGSLNWRSALLMAVSIL